MTQMRYLSFSQPWLWAILDDVARKHVENRRWMPPLEMIGKRFALHAASSWDDAGISMFIRYGLEHPQRRDIYTKGAIVGVATIEMVVTEARRLPAEQRRWFFETKKDEKQNYGWLLSDIRTLATPIPMKGGQGFRFLDPAIVREIDRQLAIANDAARDHSANVSPQK